VELLELLEPLEQPHLLLDKKPKQRRNDKNKNITKLLLIISITQLNNNYVIIFIYR
jgi:hypothetical protein